jgi:hypothetical protein
LLVLTFGLRNKVVCVCCYIETMNCIVLSSYLYLYFLYCICTSTVSCRFIYIDPFVLYHYVCDYFNSMSVLFAYFVSFCYLNFSNIFLLSVGYFNKNSGSRLFKHNTLQRTSNFMKYDTHTHTHTHTHIYILVRY